MKAPWLRRQPDKADPSHALAALRADAQPAPDDEPGEIAGLRQELRAAAWHRARLAALGTTIAKASHDARGLLSPALLAAERLQGHGDPAIRRVGDMLIANIDRMTDLLRRTVDYARVPQFTPSPSSFALRPLLEQAVAVACVGRRPPALALSVDPALEIDADREAMSSVFTNLIGNAAEAGATRLRIATTAEPGAILVEIADDGPGLPQTIRDKLFRPPASGQGRGFGLAIAHDLLVAEGGGLALAETGPGGTVFVVTLSTKNRPPMPRNG